jgi:hypothetical protein
MRALVGSLALVMVMGLAGCVTGTAPSAGSCVTMAPGPDGKLRKTVIEASDPGMLAALCSGEGPVLVADDAPKPAPVVPKAAPLPAPVQNRPATVRPATVRPAPFGPACGLVMVGGTGYVCSRS